MPRGPIQASLRRLATICKPVIDSRMMKAPFFGARCAATEAAAQASPEVPPPMSSRQPSTAPSSARLPSNIKLDKETRAMLQRQRQLEQAASDLANLGMPSLQVPVVSLATGQSTGQDVELDERVFLTDIRADIVHRCVVYQEKGERTTLYKAKTRGEVRGGGRKPWRQKGTGRARQASIRSPLWKGGGVAHAPILRDWDIKLQKKVRRLGMRIALAAKWRDRRFTVVDKFVVPGADGQGESSKTSAAVALLEQLGLTDKRVLFIDALGAPAAFKLAISNIPRAHSMPQLATTVRDIVRAERVFITAAALERLTERITKDM